MEVSTKNTITQRYNSSTAGLNEGILSSAASALPISNSGRCQRYNHRQFPTFEFQIVLEFHILGDRIRVFEPLIFLTAQECVTAGCASVSELIQSSAEQFQSMGVTEEEAGFLEESLSHDRVTVQ